VSACSAYFLSHVFSYVTHWVTFSLPSSVLVFLWHSAHSFEYQYTVRMCVLFLLVSHSWVCESHRKLELVFMFWHLTYFTQCNTEWSRFTMHLLLSCIYKKKKVWVNGKAKCERETLQKKRQSEKSKVNVLLSLTHTHRTWKRDRYWTQALNFCASQKCKTARKKIIRQLNSKLTLS